MIKMRERKRFDTEYFPAYINIWFQMRLQRSELMHLVELMKVMQNEKEGDKTIIKRQQEIIDNFERGCDRSGHQEEGETE